MATATSTLRRLSVPAPFEDLLPRGGYDGLGEGYGRVTAVQLDVAATGKGSQRRSIRMEIRPDAGRVTWRAAPTAARAAQPVFRSALCSARSAGWSNGRTTP